MIFGNFKGFHRTEKGNWYLLNAYCMPRMLHTCSFIIVTYFMSFIIVFLIDLLLGIFDQLSFVPLWILCIINTCNILLHLICACKHMEQLLSHLSHSTSELTSLVFNPIANAIPDISQMLYEYMGSLFILIIVIFICFL